MGTTRRVGWAVVALIATVTAAGCQRDIWTIHPPGGPSVAFGGMNVLEAHPQGGLVHEDTVDGTDLIWTKPDGSREVLVQSDLTQVAAEVGADGSLYHVLPSETHYRYQVVHRRHPDGTTSVVWPGQYNASVSRLEIGLDGVLMATISAGCCTSIVRLTGDGSTMPAQPVGGYTADAAGWLIAPGYNCSWSGCAQDGTLRRTQPTTGVSEILAGTGVVGFSGDGGPGPEAQIRRVDHVEIGGDGTIYFLDGPNRVRRIAPDGRISTYAGNGTSGFTGDGQAATGARIHAQTMTLATNGDLYISDGRRVRRIGAKVDPDWYVAMGDSYSAGTGAGAYDEGPRDEACDRTPNAFPRRLAGTSGVPKDVKHVACVGADSNDIFDSQELDTGDWVPSQLAQLGPDGPNPDVRVVTLGIGGNDLGDGLRDVMTTCLNPTKWPCENEYFHDERLVEQWWRDGTGPFPSLVETVDAVLARAPRADVWLVGYPHLFTSDPTAYPEGVCDVGGGGRILRTDAFWLNDLVDKHFAAIEWARSASSDPDRVHLIDLRGLYSANGDASRSHELCGPGDRWINGLTIFGSQLVTDSFHPNADGHEAAATYIDTLVGS